MRRRLCTRREVTNTRTWLSGRGLRWSRRSQWLTRRSMGTGYGRPKAAGGGPSNSLRDARRAAWKGGLRRVLGIIRFPNSLTMLPNIWCQWIKLHSNSSQKTVLISINKITTREQVAQTNWCSCKSLWVIWKRTQLFKMSISEKSLSLRISEGSRTCKSTRTSSTLWLHSSIPIIAWLMSLSFSTFGSRLQHRNKKRGCAIIRRKL